MTFDHRTAATLNRLALLLADVTALHVGKRDHRPDGIAFAFQRVNFCHAAGNFIAQTIEHRLHVTDLRPQLAFHLANRGLVV